MGRALRRHHRSRVIARRLRQLDRHYLAVSPGVTPGWFANHSLSQMCSCWMCMRDPWGLHRKRDRRAAREAIASELVEVA